MTEQSLPTVQDVQAAADRLQGHVHRTPVFTSSTLDARVDAQVFFKCEQFQRMGAFKIRGALNALMRLDPASRQRGVVAYSSGNHAQGVALAARELGMPAVIVMPADAPAAKRAATEGYGATVVAYDRYREDRLAIARQLQLDHGYTLIPPFDHPDVIAGQGTAALELFEETGPLDVLLVPVGGGGLISGCALAAHLRSPDCEVIGVEPEAGNDGQQSFRTGKLVSIDTPATLADGAQSQSLGTITFPLIQQLVSDMVTVSDAELLQAMGFLAERMNLLVEPTGCLAAAAVVKLRERLRGKRVGVILTGGNVDLQHYARLLLEAEGAATR
ncbi:MULTISPECIES: threo-3-hydroxy-L-aspartate ammonia-lyase [unclassified Pseudomonas]|uniref:threo-3-hydroxy-L-aspartate ammonia-lyase n=1 Tax=unclassified Pseudomonas TaxID=196821 RepID=UPI001944389A|nr:MULTISPECIES: threo-3-hydroxy-L-aspartate ammonia-lyase [unclassified Pseudomonas]MCE0914392.1 threo-3-hydroxy-L-aspartate ammonia-lyase [Pseudomonas sp. NMI760_13]MCF1487036.1 threo-3-hydroxy-L-aspartate ammonia-lyase [Pseudomonas sp. AA27]MCP8632875.1 threo-3-hydroxy-L-aspartate ammonia-lyase [Pseudomonas sp. DVZ6]MDD7783414.1 threo-3-hydroxy-L-aspartate ammonia-lyase [Pseudomonas sp. DVZ24]BCJ04385.1 serine/threonine dehydratase [Pseudomonas sp. RtIB026]